MEQHLKSSMPNQIEWDVARVSYISIKRAGQERVNGHQLQDRIALFNWLLQVFGVPLQSFAVVPLAEVASVPSPLDLVSARTAAGAFELGCIFSPHGYPHNNMLSRPQREHDIHMMSCHESQRGQR